MPDDDELDGVGEGGEDIRVNESESWELGVSDLYSYSHSYSYMTYQYDGEVCLTIVCCLIAECIM